MRVLVFGSFDGIHDGHRAMLRQAKNLGQHLTVVVAKDDIVTSLKGDLPKYPISKRIEFIKNENLADRVIPSDHTLNTWKVLHQNKPEIIALGYDQDELKSAVEKYLERTYPDVETEEGFQTHPKKPTIVVLEAHEPDKFHNSLL